jgi:hypothetical protein
VFFGVAGRGHERGFQRRGPGGQLVQHDVVAERQLTDVAGIEARDEQGAVVAGVDDGAGGDQQILQPSGVRGPDQHAGLGEALDEASHVTGVDHRAAADDHQLVGHQRHLRQQVTRDEDGTALGSQ